MNRGRKASLTLSLEQVRGMLLAIEEANRLGKQLNKHLVINWEQAGIVDWHAAQTLLFHRIARWMGEPLCAVWTAESGSAVGCHSHILAYCPKGTLLKRYVVHWIRKMGGKPTMTSVNVGPISKRKGVYGLLQYVSKSASQSACELFEIDFENGGTVEGKRCGWTQELGEAARRRRYGDGYLHFLTRTSILNTEDVTPKELEPKLLSATGKKRLEIWRQQNLSYHRNRQTLATMLGGYESRPNR